MKKHEEAISDCDSALSIDPKCTKTITQKGNALLGLERFDEAKKCYESLRALGENTSVDNLLKKLQDIQDTDLHKEPYSMAHTVCGIKNTVCPIFFFAFSFQYY